jgi:hypothetical protein
MVVVDDFYACCPRHATLQLIQDVGRRPDEIKLEEVVDVINLELEEADDAIELEEVR